MELRPLLCAILSIAVLATSELASAQESAPRSRSSILGSYNSPAFLSAGKVVKWNLEFLIEKEIRIAFLPGPNDGSSLEERPKDMRSSDANQAIVMILTQKDSNMEESRRTTD